MTIDTKHEKLAEEVNRERRRKIIALNNLIYKTIIYELSLAIIIST